MFLPLWVSDKLGFRPWFSPNPEMICHFWASKLQVGDSLFQIFRLVSCIGVMSVQLHLIYYIATVKGRCPFGSALDSIIPDAFIFIYFLKLILL